MRDVFGGGDEDLADLLPLRPRLRRFELHPEDVLRFLAHLVDGLGELDAAALAAPARVDLRLHDPHPDALRLHRLGRRDGLVDGLCDAPVLDRDAVVSENLFRLVFVDFHQGCRRLEEERKSR